MTAPIKMSRLETLREQVGTVIQAGHIAKKTSDEIASEVIALVDAHREEEIGRALEELGL